VRAGAAAPRAPPDLTVVAAHDSELVRRDSAIMRVPAKEEGIDTWRGAPSIKSPWWSLSGVGRTQAAVGAVAIDHLLPSGHVMVAPPASVLTHVPDRGSVGPPLGAKSKVIVVMPGPLQLPCRVYHSTTSSEDTSGGVVGSRGRNGGRPTSCG